MMAQSQAGSTWEINNYGKYINQFLLNTIKSIWQYERINKKICRRKMSIMFNEICITEEMLPKYTYIYFIRGTKFDPAYKQTKFIHVKIFKYLKSRYNHEVIAKLNNIQKVLSKICANKYRISLLQVCLDSKVCPLDILFNIRRARLQPGHKIKAIFIENSLDKLTKQLIKLRKLH